MRSFHRHLVSSRLRRLFLRLRGLGGESGQALIIAAVGMSAIVTFAGLAIDVGHLRYEKHRLQIAADAVTLAATMEMQACGGTANCPAMQAAAQSALTENGYSNYNLVTNCGAIPTTGMTLLVNNPACSLGSLLDPNAGKGGYVEVVLTEYETTYFARLLGWNNVALSARAEAERSGGGYCIYALDPSGSGALTVAALAAVTSSCGIMVESTSKSALTCALFAAISASQISVVGGVENFLCGMSPTPTTGASVPSPADPLSYLWSPTEPTRPACGTSTSSPYHGASAMVTLSSGSNATLYPDYAYCGGITIKAGAKATFEPGFYVLSSSKGAGGLAIDAGTSVTGTGVTFYNYGPSGGITFSWSGITASGVSLVAPTSGTYAGILFFQDPQDTAAATIMGSPSWSTKLEGTYYFPEAAVNFAFSGPVNYNILVAKDISFEFLTLATGGTLGTSGFASDYSSLANGSPTSGLGAVLIQ